MPPNIAQGVRTQFTPEEIFARTGAVVSADITSGGGKEAEMKVDLGSYYGENTQVAGHVREGRLGGGLGAFKQHIETSNAPTDKA